MVLKQSPLGERHKALGAKMADFGGWEMPIEYPGGGVLAEHDAVRNRVGIFDVSHLGKISVTGLPHQESATLAHCLPDLVPVQVGAAKP